MTIHHDIALALSVMIVLACIVFGNHCGEHINAILYFAGNIAVATFAHAQGVKQGKKYKAKKPELKQKGTP